MKVLLTVLVLLTAAAAAPKPGLGFRSLYKTPTRTINSKPKPHLIGGQEATPHSYPYQAYFEMYINSTIWYCNGALITANHILTSAYCCDGAAATYVALGAHTPWTPDEYQLRFVTTDILIHEEYDKVKITNDIAIVRTKEPVEYTFAIEPIRLPEDITEDLAGALATVTGWGVTAVHQEEISDVLRFIQVRIISNEECGEYFGNIGNSILCTSGEGNLGICHGDSGSPLVTNNMLVGIASFGVEYCQVYPSAYTRITSFLDWIRDHTVIDNTTTTTIQAEEF